MTPIIYSWVTGVEINIHLNEHPYNQNYLFPLFNSIKNIYPFPKGWILSLGYTWRTIQATVRQPQF